MQASARFSCCHQETRAFGGKPLRYVLGRGRPRWVPASRAPRRALARPAGGLSEFPPPWAVEETDACFIVRDAHGQAPAYVYFEGEAGRRGGSPAHVRRCTVLAAMRRYEFCQVFCRGIRAKLRCSLIPFSRLGDIRLNSDSAEPPDEKRIERLSQRESGSSAACFGGAL
jgi:hypothetical protein